ncbi:YdcF family protein [Pelagibacterium sp.]|uniref:YdcF family protein n=1 Tax=Pelagibacterium sp. TaxID=1967288 RepID=UPI003BABDA74
MFFALSQILDFFVTPSNILLLAILMALVLGALRLRRLALTLGTVSTAGLVLAAWSPLGVFALGILENRFPKTGLPDEIAGIIVLGGAVDTHISYGRSALVLNEAGERIVETLILAARYPEAEIFLSGGGGHLADDGSLTESELAGRALIDAGVAPGRISMEESSRNTCENARETAAVLADRATGNWVLVTSASHMPRAVGCFNRAGLDVLPYPVDYRTTPAGTASTGVASSGLAATDLAAHEWIGLVSYRLAGFTDVLFPSPED